MKRQYVENADASAIDLEIVLRLRFGVLVLGPEGVVLSQNPAAQRLLGDGLSLQGGRLCVADASTARALSDTITAVIGWRDGEPGQRSWMLQIPRPSMRPPYLVTVSHLARHETAGHVALCTVVDPSCRPVPTLDRVANLFGLTGAEARVALEIGSGAVPKEIAARLGTSYATVRTHLQRVFDKTKITSQAELVALLVQLGMAA